MKKFLMSTVLVVALATSSFAEGTGKVNSTILRNFTTEFKNASDVQWKDCADFVKASFVFENERMEAFYDTNGEVFATAKALNLEKLPTQAKRKFAQKFGDYTVKEAIQYEGVDELAYFISAENDTEKVIVKVTPGGSVSEYQKTKK
jgi:hypothetical protein